MWLYWNVLFSGLKRFVLQIFVLFCAPYFRQLSLGVFHVVPCACIWITTPTKCMLRLIIYHSWTMSGQVNSKSLICFVWAAGLLAMPIDPRSAFGSRGGARGPRSRRGLRLKSQLHGALSDWQPHCQNPKQRNKEPDSQSQSESHLTPFTGQGAQLQPQRFFSRPPKGFFLGMGLQVMTRVAMRCEGLTPVVLTPSFSHCPQVWGEFRGLGFGISLSLVACGQFGCFPELSRLEILDSLLLELASAKLVRLFFF